MKANEVNADWSWKPDAATTAAIKHGNAVCGRSKFGAVPLPADSGHPFPRLAGGATIARLQGRMTDSQLRLMGTDMQRPTEPTPADDEDTDDVRP